jgi:hypothetical protein
MKKNVLKELQRGVNNRKKADKQNSVIAEVNKLLEYDTVRDLEILKTVGANSTLVQSETERGSIMEIEKNENFYSGTVFSRDQLIKVAVKYRLKLLPSRLFSSYLTPVIASDIKELERSISKSMTQDQAAKRNMSVEDYIRDFGEIKYTFDKYELGDKFAILAPAKCFKTEKTTAFTLNSTDPILFYKIDDTHYRVIRKWGSDFTIFRRLLGMALLNRRSLYWTAFTCITILSLSLSIAFGWGFMGLMALAGISIPIVYASEWDSDFFGKKYVTSHKSY